MDDEIKVSSSIQESNTQKFYINGKQYSSFDELPAEIKAQWDKDGNGKIDFIEKFEDSPLGALFSKEGKADLEGIKSHFRQNTDPAKLASIGSVIRGIAFLGVVGFIAYYVWQNFM